MKSRANRITFVLLTIVLFVCFAGWTLFTIPFSESTLKKLSPGMTEAQVRDILGVPNDTAKGPHAGGTCWIYQHRYFWSFRALLVDFDEGGKLIEYVRD